MSERLVSGDQQGATFVAGADELEENARFGLALLNIGQVIKDEQVKLVEFLDRSGFDKMAVARSDRITIDAACLDPAAQRRSIVSSTPMTSGPSGTRRSMIRLSSRRVIAADRHCARLRSWW